MRINDCNAYFNYSTKYPAKPNSKTTEVQTKSNQDSVEISATAQTLLSEQSTISNDEKSYVLKDIMQLHHKKDKTKEELDTYWAARKNDPKLDVALYEMDKAEALEVVAKVQNILLKSLTDQELTPEEQKMVKEDIYLQQEIQRRKSPYFS